MPTSNRHVHAKPSAPLVNRTLKVHAGCRRDRGAMMERLIVRAGNRKAQPKLTPLAQIMMPHGRNGLNNRILIALPPASLNRIVSSLEPVSLERGQVLVKIDEPLRHIYFVSRGIVSVVKTMSDGRSVEIGAIGIEGMTSALTLLGGFDRIVLEGVVQIPGSAFRMRRDAALEAMENDKAFRQIVRDHARFALGQIAQTAACNRLHHLEERCCRWLLIAHDSALSNTFTLTHEFLAMMLGSQRAGVSIALSTLKKAGIIDHKRGNITVTNRAGLEDAACECYGAMRNELDQLYGPAKIGSPCVRIEQSAGLKWRESAFREVLTLRRSRDRNPTNGKQRSTDAVVSVDARVCRRAEYIPLCRSVPNCTRSTYSTDVAKAPARRRE
jgi:CRP-like cAMP-binding protein